MKKILILMVCAAVPILGVTNLLLAGGKNEASPYKKAIKEAQAENKLVLLDFTGSDWCEGCMHLDKEVFSTPEFKDYAAKNLVLLQVDFPVAKPQSPQSAEQNEQLKIRFQVDAFPNLIVLDRNGRQLASWIGYDGGGPKWLIDKIEALKKQ